MSLKVCNSIEQLLRDHEATRPGARLGLVTSTGHLHPGSLELIQEAKRIYDCVVVVFLDGEEMAGASCYPYEELSHNDHEHLTRQGVEYVLVQSPALSPRFRVEDRIFSKRMGLDKELVDRFLTAHLKLILQLQPAGLFFSDLHYRQAQILKNFMEDFQLNVVLNQYTLTRDARGLPHSSVNTLLNESDREFAAKFSKILRENFKNCIGLMSEKIVTKISDLLEDEGFTGVKVHIFDDRLDHEDTIGKRSRLFASIRIKNYILEDNLAVS